MKLKHLRKIQNKVKKEKRQKFNFKRTFLCLEKILKKKKEPNIEKN